MSVGEGIDVGDRRDGWRFHVAQRIPVLPEAVRQFGPMVFAEHFGYTPTIEARRWYLATDAGLVEEAPSGEGIEHYIDDPEAGPEGYATEFLYNLNIFTQPTVRTHWTPFADEYRVAFETEPLAEAVTVAGSGHVDLWLQPGTVDTAVQATVTEIRPDAVEHGPVHPEA